MTTRRCGDCVHMAPWPERVEQMGRAVGDAPGFPLCACMADGCKVLAVAPGDEGCIAFRCRSFERGSRADYENQVLPGLRKEARVMISNDERRAIAARLRNNARSDWGWVVPWAVFNDAAGHDGEINNRLADLIEPEPERCDRDALLKLADYLDEDAALLCQRMIELPIKHWDGYEGAMAQQETWIAHKIRKACGAKVVGR